MIGIVFTYCWNNLRRANWLSDCKVGELVEKATKAYQNGEYAVSKNSGFLINAFECYAEDSNLLIYSVVVTREDMMKNKPAKMKELDIAGHGKVDLVLHFGLSSDFPEVVIDDINAMRKERGLPVV